MNEEIKAWLQGPRVYMEGVALYDRYGVNKQLKAAFNRNNDRSTADMLVYELGKIANITEQELKTMPRVAENKTAAVVPAKIPTAKPAFIDDLLLQFAQSFGVSVDDIFGVPISPIALNREPTPEEIKLREAIIPKYEAIPETMKKVIRIREVYPFLSEASCPTELKLLVHDMFNAYDDYRTAYAGLSDKNTQDENLLLAAKVVESYLDNRAMWEELDYYKENAIILGKHEIFELLKMREEIAGINDMELISKLTKTKPNITKAKNALEKAETDEKKTECLARLDKWTTYVAELEAEIDRRKKQ